MRFILRFKDDDRFKLRFGERISNDYDANTKDATATAGDILLDKTAYVNGQKVTGVIPKVMKSETVVSSKTNAIYPNGYYDGSVPIYIEGTTNGNAMFSNNGVAKYITFGQNLFGVLGTAKFVYSATFTATNQEQVDLTYDKLSYTPSFVFIVPTQSDTNRTPRTGLIFASTSSFYWGTSSVRQFCVLRRSTSVYTLKIIGASPTSNSITFGVGNLKDTGCTLYASSANPFNGTYRCFVGTNLMPTGSKS